VSQGKEASGREGGPEKGPLRSALRLPRKRLEAILDEALVDCYNETEEATGLYTMIEDNVACPFTTRVLDVEVEVEKLDLTDTGEVVAIAEGLGVDRSLSVLGGGGRVECGERREGETGCLVSA